MKKLLLCLLSGALTFGLNSQILTANNNTGFSSWSLYDADMDTYNWGIYNISSWGTAISSQGECALSFSYGDPSQNPNFTALSPDNWIITPAMNFTDYTNAYVNFSIGALDNTNFAEHFAVYASDDIFTLTSSVALYEETMSTGAAMNARSVDLSAFDGMATVYLAFRHFNVSNESAVVLDDVVVNGTNTADINEEQLNFSIYPNPAIHVLNLDVDGEIYRVKLTSLNGAEQTIVEQFSNFASIDISAYSAGYYLIEAELQSGRILRRRFLKIE